MTGSFRLRIGIISVVIGGHFGGGDHFDGGDHFGGGTCSSRARWPLVPNFCSQVTRKSQIFHTNHMPGSLDFTVSEHWAPFNFP